MTDHIIHVGVNMMTCPSTHNQPNKFLPIKNKLIHATIAIYFRQHIKRIVKEYC